MTCEPNQPPRLPQPAASRAEHRAGPRPATQLQRDDRLPKIIVLPPEPGRKLDQTRLVHKVTADDVVVAALPLFHIFGLQISTNLALLQGATVVICPGSNRGILARRPRVPGHQGRARAPWCSLWPPAIA